MCLLELCQCSCAREKGLYWSRGPNYKYLFKCQRPAALVGGIVNETTDGVRV